MCEISGIELDDNWDLRGISSALSSSRSLSEIEQKTQRAFSVASKEVTAGGKAEVKIEWGGNEGPSISGSISGNVSDNKGNKAEAKVEVQADGKGSATVSVSHDEDMNS